MKILALVLILLMQGCSTIEDTTCPSVVQLKGAESKKLNDMVLNNHFISGCVTELISDLKALQPAKLQSQCQGDFDKTLNYAQWVKIYNACLVE